MRLIVTSVFALALAAALMPSASLAGDIPTKSGSSAEQPPSNSKKKGSNDARATTLAEAWRLLPQVSGQRCGDDLSFDYGDAGGMRNLASRHRAALGRGPRAPAHDLRQRVAGLGEEDDPAALARAADEDRSRVQVVTGGIPQTCHLLASITSRA